MREGDGWLETQPPDKQCPCPHGASQAGEGIPPTLLVITLLPPVIILTIVIIYNSIYCYIITQ